MELMVAVAVVVLAVGGVMAVSASAKRQDAWRAVARRRGATFHEPSGLFSRRSYAIEAEIGNVRVYLDWYVVSSGESSTTYTRARAMFPLPVGPRFKVYREGFLASMGKALGTQDVVLGVRPSFDQVFMVKCDYPALVRAVWTASAQARMEHFAPNGRAVCDGREVMVTVQGHVIDALTLDALLDLTGELAGADILGIGALAALPTAHVQREPAPWDAPATPRVVLERPAGIAISPVMSGNLVCTRVTGSAAREHPAFHTAIEADGRPLAPLPDGALPVAAAKPLRDLAGGRLTVEAGAAAYWFSRIETDPARLQAAVALIATFSRAPHGVFR